MKHLAPILYAYVILRITGEYVYSWVSQENLFHLHTAITAGIVVNMLLSLLLFLSVWRPPVIQKFIKKHKPILVTFLKSWLGFDIFQSGVRLYLQHVIYNDPDPSAAWNLLQDYFIPAYWIVLFIALGWIHRKHLKP